MINGVPRVRAARGLSTDSGANASHGQAAGLACTGTGAGRSTRRSRAVDTGEPPGPAQQHGVSVVSAHPRPSIVQAVSAMDPTASSAADGIATSPATSNAHSRRVTLPTTLGA